MVTTAAVLAAAAVASASYGVYAGERARAAAQRQADAASQKAQQFQDQQNQQLAQQKADAQKLATDQSATQTQTLADIKAAQAAAIDQERAGVPALQQQLADSLATQNTQALQKQQPILEARLNSLGLLQSGALPAQQAKYQADLENQRQNQLTNYAFNANNTINQNQYANSVQDVGYQQQNMMNNLNTAQQNLAQQYASQNVANQNNVAYDQYVASLQGASNMASQQAANSYVNLGGQIGAGAINYYGNQQNANSAIDYGQGGSLPPQYRNKYNWGTDYSSPIEHISWGLNR